MFLPSSIHAGVIDVHIYFWTVSKLISKNACVYMINIYTYMYCMSDLPQMKNADRWMISFSSRKTKAVIENG